MVGGAVNAEDLATRWRQSAGPLSTLDLERLVAFDEPLWRAQLYMKRHAPGVAIAEVTKGRELIKSLDKRMIGLDTAIKFPGVRSSQQAIEAAIDQVSVVRTAVRMLAGLPR